MILDLRRVTEIDSTGANALLELKPISPNGKRLLAVGDQTAMERLENFEVFCRLTGKRVFSRTLIAPSSAQRTAF